MALYMEQLIGEFIGMAGDLIQINFRQVRYGNQLHAIFLADRPQRILKLLNQDRAPRCIQG